MDLCIKTVLQPIYTLHLASFNPCFNGSMYKNNMKTWLANGKKQVSILVLMDLCIKTSWMAISEALFLVSILVLMDLCIKTAF